MSTTDPLEEIKEIARSNIVGLRKTMKKLDVVVAKVDCDLRYVWIENPHPDFDPVAALGKRDDELIPASEAVEIMGVKRAVLQQKAVGLACPCVQAFRWLAALRLSRLSGT